MKRKITMLLIFIIIGSISLSGCASKKEKLVNKEAYSQQKFMMGTYVRIQIYDEGKEPVLKKAFNRVTELADKITVNEENSEVDAINNNAGEKPVKVSDDVYRLVKKAYDYSRDSRGGFDLTIGPITQMWHIGFDDARKPTQAEIDAVLPLVDYQKVELDEKNKTVFLKEKGMKLDLGAIAKGYITDEVIKVLKKNQVTTAIVDLGGNVYVLGDSPRKASGEWTVGVQDPNQARNTTVGTIKARNQSLVTSGIYERNLTVDGQTYHHLFNPKTGYPFANDIAGVTIISKKSVDGDGLSTAIFAMGVKDGMKYIEDLKEVEAIFVTTEDQIYLSSGVKESFSFNDGSGYQIAELKKE